MAALALGAEGIEMGTRFIATKECVHAHPAYKEMILNATENDTVIIKRSLGAPGRVLANAWAEKILEIERQGGTYDDLKEYISGEANRRFIYEGKVDEGFAWAGQAIGLIHDVPSVAELFARMMEEAEQIRRRWAN